MRRRGTPLITYCTRSSNIIYITLIASYSFVIVISIVLLSSQNSDDLIRGFPAQIIIFNARSMKNLRVNLSYNLNLLGGGSLIPSKLLMFDQRTEVAYQEALLCVTQFMRFLADKRQINRNIISTFDHGDNGGSASNMPILEPHHARHLHCQQQEQLMSTYVSIYLASCVCFQCIYIALVTVTVTI